ncbi:MAG: hybrid sensor histidine kinase/response regulator [Desulfobacteraceae bacterium]|nr:hybrid sensor histidine kinase/response regulator [Desulfobacteraceae bacterium]
MENSVNSTILIVDDEKSCIETLIHILEDSYDICVAINAKGAMDAVKKKPPDLILLDIVMPGIDGYQICENLKNDGATKNIPVIFLTGLTGIDHEIKGLECGAIDYITKPISPSIVKARIKNHLELQLARRDLKKQNIILQENIALREEIQQITRHDIKSPLSCVINIPKIMLSEGGLTQSQQIDLETISKLGYRILSMINNSLELHRMECGKYQLKPKSVDIVKIIVKICEEMQIQFSEKKININISIDGIPLGRDDQFLINGEELLCYTMMTNIIKNAIEACEKKNTIAIDLNNKKVQQICVHNPGCVLEKIRDSFFDKYVTLGKPGGTGLGTYSAKLMAKVQKGDIKLDTDEKKGTIVTVYLPGAKEL